MISLRWYRMDRAQKQAARNGRVLVVWSESPLSLVAHVPLFSKTGE